MVYNTKILNCIGLRLRSRNYFMMLIMVISLLIIVISFYLITWRIDSWDINSCSLSQIESNNFFCESNYLWIKRKMMYAFQDKLNTMKFSNIFIKSQWEPNFHCSHQMRIGKMGDGGKWVCDPLKLKRKDDCLVYSAGSNGDFSFEIELKRLLPKCSIITLDKDNYSCPKELCTFHQAFLGNGSSTNSKNWFTIIQELKHTNRIIDIFKIDIEGSEYDFFADMFNSNISKKNFPRQILVELHPTLASQTNRFFELFRKNYYAGKRLFGGVRTSTIAQSGSLAVCRALFR